MADNRDRKISGYPSLGDIQMFVAEVVANKDEHAKSRFRCRMVGHESDQINVPDETLPFYSAVTPETAHRGMGYNPRYVPGDKVICLQFGEERFIIGATRKETPYEGEEADVNPWTLDGNASPKSPQAEKNDKQRGWSKEPSEKKTTQEARESKRTRQQSKKEQGESQNPNTHGRKSTRFMDNLSIGKDNIFDNSTNPMQYIQSRIQNNGAVVPQMLQMVQQLKKKPRNTNPHAIQAVGAQNYMQFIQGLAKYFSSIKDASQKEKQRQEEEKKTEEEKAREEAEMRLAEQYAREEEQNGGQ